MIKVLTGFSGPGGSTVAFNNLVNLFNKNGFDACLYGPHEWDGITCKFKLGSPDRINPEDTVIYHFMNPPNNKCKKLILSCHETEIFPIKKIPLEYDVLHFVSKFQKDWQGVDGVVIPNVINKYEQPKVFPKTKVAGIIGSIDPNKQVHVSIDRALADMSVDSVEIWGNISDFNYFNQEVIPRLGPSVSYHGISSNMQEVYDRTSVVYASSKMECLPTIHGECLQLGIEYKGLTPSTRVAKDYEFDDDAIMAKWKEIL